MKPKEFIQKHGIEKGWNPKQQNVFLQDFTSELLAFLELYKAENNIKGFDNAIKVMRMKWDAISAKIPFGLPEKVWSYWWATVVVNLREQLCPKEMERRRQEAEERRRGWEERMEWRRREMDFLNSLYEEERKRRMEFFLSFLFC